MLKSVFFLQLHLVERLGLEMLFLKQLSVISRRYCSPSSIAVLSRFSSSFILPPNIEFEELKKKLENNDITLIDVRNPSEHAKLGMIPNSKSIILEQVGNSILLPESEFAEKVGFKKPALDDPLAVNCYTGVRARTAQLAIMAVGYKNVRLYKGSFKDWLEKGGPLVFPPVPDTQG